MCLQQRLPKSLILTRTASLRLCPPCLACTEPTPIPVEVSCCLSRPRTTGAARSLSAVVERTKTSPVLQTPAAVLLLLKLLILLGKWRPCQRAEVVLRELCFLTELSFG